MAWVWTEIGALGLATAALTAMAAVLVWSTSAGRLQNRLLALFLALHGAFILAGWGLMYMTDTRSAAYAWQGVGLVFQFASIPIYVAFLSTLRTPWARPFVACRPFLYALAPLAPVAWFLWPDRFVPTMVQGAASPWDIVVGSGFTVLATILVVVSGLGALLAWSAFRSAAPGSLLRAQAMAYLAAFLVLDVVQGATYAVSIISFPVALGVLQILGYAAFVILLGYGVLKTRLFDIDLRIKWTLSRGTVAGVFLAVFLVATEGAQLVFGSRDPWLGVGAAALLVFAIAPLQRFADRLSDAAMPGATGDTDYRLVRKRRVYRAALESALVDGELTAKDRGVLASLAQELGLGAKDAHELEIEALRSGAGATAAPA